MILIKKSPPAETACKQQLPPAAKTRMMFYAETSFSSVSSEEDSKELSVTTLTFEKAVDSISFLISEHGTRTIRLHEMSAASTSVTFRVQPSLISFARSIIVSSS